MSERPRLVSTAKAAAAVGVDRTTLFRWWKAEKVTTMYRTPSGHLRWNVEDLQRQLATEPVREELSVSSAAPESMTEPIHPATAPEDLPVAAAIVTCHLGVLAGRRNDNRPPWTFISGEVEPGESIADAAVREVKEETGLEVRPGHLELGRRVHPKTQRLMIYLACLPAGAVEDIFVGDTEELAEVRWLSLAQVYDLMGRDLVFEPVRDHLERVIT